jgi:hypothetical protein
MAVSQRDLAAAVGTVAGEALNESFEGQAAVVDVLANRVTYAKDGYGVITEPGIAGVARAGRYGPSGRAGMKEFDAWSPSTNARAYATATMFERAILDPSYRETLPETHRAKLDQIERVTHGVLVDGSLRGISKGATFYNNPGITSTAMNGKMDALRPTGSFRIGGHVFGGKNYDPNAKFDTAAAKANAHAGWAATGVYDTAGEKSRDQRAIEASRADMMRDDAAVTAPYWDGSMAQTAPAPAPVDFGVTTNPDLSAISLGPAADYYDFGQYTTANAVPEAPATRGIEPAGWAPDPAAVANFSGGLEGANRGYGGGLPESWAEAPAAPDNFAGSLESSNAGTGIFDSYATGGAFGADRMPDNFAAGLEMANAGQIGAFDNAPATRGFSAPDRAVDVGWGVGAREDRSAVPRETAPMDLGPIDLGANLSGSLPSSQMVDPFATIPQQAYPLDLPDFGFPASTPTTTTRSIAAPAPTTISRPESTAAPNRPSSTAAPSRAAPSLPAPISVATPAISPSFGQGLTGGLNQAQEALRGFGSADDFLGSVVGGGGGGRADSVAALNAATGMDYSGMAQRAAGDDQYAQPAMLGLGNAYAQATGQQGYRGLFDGLFGSSAPAATTGWGTGGLYDPSGTGGLYDPGSVSGGSGLFGGFFDGMFGGNGGGFGGSTPGSGGLY